MVDIITQVNSTLNSFVWGPVVLALLMGTGVFLTIRTRCIQVRRFGYIMKNTVGSLFKKSDEEHGNNLSPFQAVATALAGTVGTGNIAGVTGAIFVGGPGAAFWMWVSAFFGMCTKYSEIALAVKYRVVDKNGVHKGGPMYYIENGIGKNFKWLAVIFSFLGGFASFGIGNISQSNEIAGAMTDLFEVAPLVTGLVLALIVGIVIIGGVKRIGQVCSYLVPFMSIFYILVGIAVLVLKLSEIPAALATILRSAFSLEAVGGGVFGYAIMLAIRQGVARGVFSNEAGMGSAPMAHAASSTVEPAKQAMWGVFEVFIDTIVICSITALTVVLSGIELGEEALSGYVSNGAAAAAAFNAILPGTLGGTFVHIGLLLFALSTLLSWSYYGETCFGYLSNDNKIVILIYKIIFVLVCIVGATGSGTLMWNISDTLNGMMAIPNLVALIILSAVVSEITKNYFDK